MVDFLAESLNHPNSLAEPNISKYCPSRDLKGKGWEDSTHVKRMESIEIDTGIFEDRWLKPQDIPYEESLVDVSNYIYISYLIVLHLCLVYFNLFSSSGNVFHALHRKVNVDILIYLIIMVISSYSQSSLCSGSVDKVSPKLRCPFWNSTIFGSSWFISFVLLIHPENETLEIHSSQKKMSFCFWVMSPIFPTSFACEPEAEILRTWWVMEKGNKWCLKRWSS